jgi:hypothetical protein
MILLQVFSTGSYRDRLSIFPSVISVFLPRTFKQEWDVEKFYGVEDV